MTKGADLLVAALESEGVKRIFGLPGEENLDVVESLRNSRIEMILTRHEQAASFMAATQGRLTGRPGVCLSTLGPGALNFTTGAAYAHLGAMPMLMITGQKAIKSARQARFQIVDIVGAMRPLTKMTRQIVSAASIPTIVRDAFRVAVEERPGPVHIELPEDIAAEQADVALVPPHPIDRPVAPASALDRAVAMILASKHPLIMIGAASNRPRLVEPLSDFVRRCRIPFFNTQMGKGAVTGGSNLYLGTAALSERDYVHDAIDCADLIIAIGHDTVEKPPFLMSQIGGPRVLYVGYVSATVEEVFHPDAEVVGDIGATVTALADRLDGALVPDPDILALRREILGHINERADSDQFPVIPQRLVRDVRAVMPEDGIVCLDNGMYKIWFARNYRTHVANTLLLDNALATMGAGLASAMAAKLLDPHRRVMAVCGDGGFMMNSQELETAMRLKLNLVVLIVEDRAYGMIRWKQAVDGFADFGMTFGNPDFVKYAESYGARGHRIAAAGELVPTLEAAFAAGGVHLVVVPVDYSENTRVFVDELGGRAPETEPG
ncbi:acetolactate synthase large subunit [Bradyrhizobium erythrophlei]|uniref:Acetolactate synthase-1/2/3 large subunit n=1 Tax=Bradyrhizobium erythrophlei TaxID=1437360 RepID=A0A1M5YR80_9BRAD|nr:acetolactate synthase large subunit [Bradyrhizobium erythrophlei]SHI14595.1 acetolactate synthase-1/2/3 large subunit [Bradyrhizobium erythrophlei]